MGKIDTTDRLVFLAEKFNVFEAHDMDMFYTSVETDEVDEFGRVIADVNLLEPDWSQTEICSGDLGNILAVVSYRFNKRGIKTFKISVEYKVFTAMVGSDPTNNKICLQWMLNIFTKLLKSGDTIEAVRFVEEDLPQAYEYLKLFEANKRKQKFYTLGKFTLKGINDITNINEYGSLTQLYDAVDPFIERDPSEIESLMVRYVENKQASIPFKDRRYTVFVPLSVDANVIFDNFSGWCTSKVGNSQWKRYTTDYLRPDGKPSTIFIVIDNGFFNGENENIYQIHFETNQIHNRSNESMDNFFGDVLSKSLGLRNFFGDTLAELSKKNKVPFDRNKYIDHLIAFGFTDAFFDFFDIGTPIIKIDNETSKRKIKIPSLPDLSRFKDLKHLVVMDSTLHELGSSIGQLKSLKLLTVRNNFISELPSELGELNNLIFLNVVGNPIKRISDNIKYLDKSMGGNLSRIAVNESEIGEANYRKLKELLPNVQF